jgi:hypothetical protein
MARPPGSLRSRFTFDFGILSAIDAAELRTVI